MSAIDYGCVIFKNGVRYKSNDLFPEIDEVFNMTCYKSHIEFNQPCGLIICNKPQAISVETRGYLTYMWLNSNYKTFHFTMDKGSFKIKSLGEGIYICIGSYNGDKYHMIFGYGIDNRKTEWNRIKYIYHGKKMVKKIDKIFDKWGY